MSEQFKGFCFNEQMQHTPAVILESVAEVISYCKIQGLLHHEVRITDHTEDDTVFQVIGQLVVWPESLKGIHIKDL